MKIVDSSTQNGYFFWFWVGMVSASYDGQNGHLPQNRDETKTMSENAYYNAGKTMTRLQVSQKIRYLGCPRKLGSVMGGPGSKSWVYFHPYEIGLMSLSPILYGNNGS